MRLLFPVLFCYLSVPFFAAAQNIELPDSSKIRSNHIKSITIYKEAPNTPKKIQKTVEYNRHGRITKEIEANGKDWVEMSYDTIHRKTEQRFFVNMSLISKISYSYTSDRYVYSESHYAKAIKSDTLTLVGIYEYNMKVLVKHSVYENGKLAAVYNCKRIEGSFSKAYRDSLINDHQVVWHRDDFVTKKNQYDTNWNLLQTDSFYYDKMLRLEKEVIYKKDVKTTYTPIYNQQGKVTKVLKNNIAIPTEQISSWIKKHEDLLGFAYADHPAPMSQDNSSFPQPTLDSNGLIISVSYFNNTRFTYDYQKYD